MDEITHPGGDRRATVDLLGVATLSGCRPRLLRLLGG
ncbi:hypothetical protein ACVLV4_002143 [Rathayibacter agropyri]